MSAPRSISILSLIFPVRSAIFRGELNEFAAFVKTHKGLDDLSFPKEISNLNEDVFRGIGRLTKLETLDLDSIKGVTGRNLAHLKDLDKLTSLLLDGTDVNDEGLKEVAKLCSLEFLNLNGTNVNDEGLQEVAKLTNLTYLQLDGTNVNDEGLQEVAKLSKLVWLSLGNTKMTGAGVAHLSQLPSLEMLSLRGAEDVTEDDMRPWLEHGSGWFPELNYLNIDGTALTPEFVQALRTRYPNAIISFKTPSPPKR